jgi:hypothetical protein
MMAMRDDRVGRDGSGQIDRAEFEVIHLQRRLFKLDHPHVL